MIVGGLYGRIGGSSKWRYRFLGLRQIHGKEAIPRYRVWLEKSGLSPKLATLKSWKKEAEKEWPER